MTVSLRSRLAGRTRPEYQARDSRALFRLILADVPEHHAGTGSGVLVTGIQVLIAAAIAIGASRMPAPLS